MELQGRGRESATQSDVGVAFHVSCKACCARARHIHTDDLPHASQSRPLFGGASHKLIFILWYEKNDWRVCGK